MRRYLLALMFVASAASAQVDPVCKISWGLATTGGIPWAYRLTVDGTEVAKIDYPATTTTCAAHSIAPDWRAELCVYAFNGAGESVAVCVPFASTDAIVPGTPGGLSVIGTTTN